MKKEQLRTFILFLLLLTFVIGLSTISNRIWTNKSEKMTVPKTLIIGNDMTVAQFGKENGIPNEVLKQVFSLQTTNDLSRKVSEYGTADEITARVKGKMAIIAEHASKNWMKIVIKFALWFIYLTYIFLYFKKHKISPRNRNWLLFISVIIFGVIMGSDPGPMGTVKDAIFLLSTSHVIFPPRLIALTVFLMLVFVVNKYICSWGCQAGTLQDLIFRLNTKNGKPVIWKQIKIPFVITNTIRIAFLLVFTAVAVLWGTDIIEKIDIFKIFNFTQLGLIGIIFLGLIATLSLFIYRPWCHFFCPFGLVGWLVEKISIVKVSVNYDTCIACKKCANACPSTVMSAILMDDKKTVPDCFSCYACRDICPTGSIAFSKRKRTKPPLNFFEQK